MKKKTTSEINLEQSDNIHLIGIGGTGMSGLANCLIHLGHNISGSDMNESDAIKKLKATNITVLMRPY